MKRVGPADASTLLTVSLGAIAMSSHTIIRIANPLTYLAVMFQPTLLNLRRSFAARFTLLYLLLLLLRDLAHGWRCKQCPHRHDKKDAEHAVLSLSFLGQLVGLSSRCWR